jgi:hypothetical protein
MARSHRRLVAVLSCTAALALATVGLVSTGAGAQSSSVPGITAKSVKVGYIYSGTGVAASNFAGADKGFQARIDRANAAGGVNGRKIQTELVDDASTAANLTAAQDLVQNRNVFAVVNNSPFAFLAYRYLLSQGVPLIGGGYDGTYYGVKGNENIISALGNVVSSSDGAPDGLVDQYRHRAGPRAERRPDEGQPALHRLRPGPAGLARRRDPGAEHDLLLAVRPGRAQDQGDQAVPG